MSAASGGCSGSAGGQGSSIMKVFGKKLATAGIAFVSAGAIAVAPTVQAPPRPVPAVQLAAATSPTVVQPLAQQSNVLGALFSLDLRQVHHPAERGSAAPHAARDSRALPRTHRLRIRRRHQEHLHSHRAVGGVRGRPGHLCGRLDSLGGLARSSNRHLLPFRGAHRPKPRVQFRRLALGPAALTRGLGKHRAG